MKRMKRTAILLAMILLAASSLGVLADESIAEDVGTPEQAESVGEPAGPVEEPAVPSEAQTEPSEEPTEPSEVPTEPSEVPTEPSEAPTEPSEAPTEPSEEPTEPSEAPTEPSEAPTEPSEEPTEPSEEPTEPSEEPTEPSEEPTEPSEEPTEPSEAPTEPGGDPTEPSEEPTESSEEPTLPEDVGPAPNASYVVMDPTKGYDPAKSYDTILLSGVNENMQFSTDGGATYTQITGTTAEVSGLRNMVNKVLIREKLAEGWSEKQEITVLRAEPILETKNANCGGRKGQIMILFERPEDMDDAAYQQYAEGRAAYMYFGYVGSDISQSISGAALNQAVNGSLLLADGTSRRFYAGLYVFVEVAHDGLLQSDSQRVVLRADTNHTFAGRTCVYCGAKNPDIPAPIHVDDPDPQTTEVPTEEIPDETGESGSVPVIIIVDPTRESSETGSSEEASSAAADASAQETREQSTEGSTENGKPAERDKMVSLLRWGIVVLSFLLLGVICMFVYMAKNPLPKDENRPEKKSRKKK